MIKWVPITFVRVVAVFISGIACGIYFPDILPTTGLAVLLSVGLVCYFILHFLRKFNYDVRLPGGIIALTVIFVAGYANVIIHNPTTGSTHLSSQREKVRYYTCVATTAANDRSQSWKQEVKIKHIFTDQWHVADGNVIVYFSKSVFAKPFEYGDVLLIEGTPQPVPGPTNPDEFDYRQYLAYQNIFHQQAIRQSHVVKIGRDVPSQFMAMAIDARMWADAVLAAAVSGQRERAIASALVLGVTDGLDNDLLNAYSATGAMHVLAVSGLHISIIYMLLIAMLRPLKKTTTGKIILAITGLAVLWGYAFVTGLSPSVLRAVTMFSFMAVAKPIERNTNIFNTMAASAFLLLVFDPLLIMSVGFQLSYLAVIGIVAIHPDLYATWQPRFRIVDEVWKISSVSIAAQISTFGLGLLYFNQFPNYFLLSNLLVIPISFVVLIAGIAVIAFSWIPFVGGALGWVLTWSIKLLNLSVFFVERLPFNLVENIHISAWQCWLLMIMACSLVLLFQKKKFHWMVVSFFAAVVFSVLQWVHFVRQVDPAEIAVYNVRSHTAIDLLEKGQCVFITDSAYENNRSDIKFHIAPNRVLHSIRRILPGPSVHQANVPAGKIISWNGQLIAIISAKEFQAPAHARFDYVIVSNDSVEDLEQIFRFSNRIILDGSNSYYYSKRMVDIAWENNKKIHAVAIHGAFTARIDHAHKSLL